MSTTDVHARSPVGIRDVAALAEVSTGTVSNTINHPERVHPRTRAAVERAIRTLGFVPNQQARVLTGASSNVIGLVVLDVESPFYMEAAHAIERATRESNHVVMLCNSDGELEREAKLLTMLAAQRVRGVLLAPANAENADRYANLPGDLAVVLIDYDAGPEHCSVSVDNIAGGRLAVQHLLELGHRRIGFVGGPTGLRQFAPARHPHGLGQIAPRIVAGDAGQRPGLQQQFAGTSGKKVQQHTPQRCAQRQPRLHAAPGRRDGDGSQRQQKATQQGEPDVQAQRAQQPGRREKGKIEDSHGPTASG